MEHPESSEEPERPGVLLKGRYRPVGVIGRGGMATVYRARDEQLGRDVAVKLYGAVPVGASSAPVFDAELRVLAGLGHHGIVTLLDAGIDDSVPHEPHPFLVMELVTGPSLDQAIAARELGPRAIAELGYDLAEVLDYLHARGIVHRDLKPSNVLLVDYGTSGVRTRALLTDFGIAVDTAVARGPEETNTSGTAAYLSPEQVLRDLVGPASDVYALGLVLLECFTGYLEFPGEPSASAVSRIASDPVVPEHLGPGWRTLLGAMLQRDPARRPAAREVVLALRQLVNDEAGRHRSVPAAAPVEEDERVDAVRRYAPVAPAGDAVFERVANLARRIADTPVAIVSMIERDEIRFLAHPGTELARLGREDGLCARVIADGGPWIVENCTLDPRVSDYELVTGEFGMRFYAGVPIASPDGYGLGVVSVVDFTPRSLGEEQLAALVDLAALVADELELRRIRQDAVA